MLDIIVGYLIKEELQQSLSGILKRLRFKITFKNKCILSLRKTHGSLFTAYLPLADKIQRDYSIVMHMLFLQGRGLPIHPLVPT